MNKEQELEYAHGILDYMLQTTSNSMYIYSDEADLNLYGHDAETIRKILVDKNLIIVETRDLGSISLSPFGREVARSEGGYKGYLKAQEVEKQRRQELEEEQRQLSRTSTEAAVQSATAAESSAFWAKVAGIAALIALVISVIALFKK